MRKLPCDGVGGSGEGRGGVAAADAAFDQAVAGAAGVELRRAGVLGLGGVGEGGERRPGDGEAVEGGGGAVLEGDERHGFAAEAGEPFGERRLVGVGGDDAEAVLARDVGGGEDEGHLRAGGGPGVEVAEGEAGVGVGGADGLEDEAAGPPEVGAEGVAAVDLGAAVEAGEAGADGGAGGRAGAGAAAGRRPSRRR